MERAKIGGDGGGGGKREGKGRRRQRERERLVTETLDSRYNHD